MPAIRFWLLHRNIDRVAAEEQLRWLDVGIGAQSGEGFKEISKSLRQQMGDVMTVKGQGSSRSQPRADELDRDGLRVLKMIQNQRVGDKVQGI